LGYKYKKIRKSQFVAKTLPLFYILKLRQPVPVRYTPTCGETMSLIILTLYREPDVHTTIRTTLLSLTLRLLELGVFYWIFCSIGYLFIDENRLGKLNHSPRILIRGELISFIGRFKTNPNGIHA